MRLDSAAWKEALENLERRWFAPLGAQLKKGRIRQLVIATVADGRSHQWSVSRMNLWRWWRRAGLRSTAMHRPLMNPARIVEREVPPAAFEKLRASGLHPVMARIYAARGVLDASQLDTPLTGLLAFDHLLNCAAMAVVLANAIAAEKRLLIVADYDADGATACAVGMLGLQSFGAKVEYLVPNRFEYGYGLTPEIVRLAARRQPDFLITVDNGIASVEGVEEARTSRHPGADHRSSSSGRATARRGLHRQSQSARMHLSEQAPGRGRRDVLCARRVARRIATSRLVQPAQGAQPCGVARPGRARYCRRRRAPGRQQSHPCRPGIAARPRRTRTRRHRCAVPRRRT